MLTSVFFIGLAIILIMVSKVPVAIAMYQNGGYNNRYPRQQQSNLTGWGCRALAAHQNTLEGFPVFAAAIISGVILQVPEPLLMLVGGVYCLSRLLYIGFYLLNWHLLRSTVWGIGLVACLFPFLYPFI